MLQKPILQDFIHVFCHARSDITACAYSLAEALAASRFLQSDTLKSFLAFVRALSRAVEARTLSDAIDLPPVLGKVLEALTVLEGWVAEIPPVQQSLRYGNPAFR